jgi:hypothetical protein
MNPEAVMVPAPHLEGDGQKASISTFTRNGADGADLPSRGNNPGALPSATTKEFASWSMSASLRIAEML